MTPKRFKTIQKKLNLSNKLIAKLLGVTKRTILYWKSGTHKIPKTTGLYLESELGEIPKKIR